MFLAAGYSRQRGQGAVEYILIMVVVLVLVGGAAWMFREPLAGLMNRFTGVMTGESSSASGTDDGASDASSAAAEDSGAGGTAGEEGGGADAASSSGGEGGGAVKEKAETAETEEADLPEEGLGASFGGGIGIWVAVGAGLFIVMVVLYFLNASKR